MSKSIQRLNISTLAFIAVAALLLFLALRALLFLDVEGSPFPHMDDWQYQQDMSFLTAVLMPNNENFQAFTNALYWLAPRINIPFWTLRYVSFVTYIFMLFMLYGRLKPYVPKKRRFLLLLAFAPCFSAYMCGNLLWTSLIQIWIFFILILAAIKYGFELPQTPKNQILTFICLILSVMAMNMTLALIFAALYFLRTLYRAKSLTDREFSSSIMMSALVIITTLTVLSGIRHADASISYKPLLTAPYWLYLSYGLTGVLNGFRISAENTTFYYITGAILILWIAFLILRQIKTEKNHALIALSVMLLGGFAIITLLRQEHILAIHWHVSRHIVYAIFLIPVIYALGANDKLKSVHIAADILLVTTLLTASPIYDNIKLRNNFGPERITDICLVQNITYNPLHLPFHCRRNFTDIRIPLQYFLTHDTAFKTQTRPIYRLSGKRKILSHIFPLAQQQIKHINRLFSISHAEFDFNRHDKSTPIKYQQSH